MIMSYQHFECQIRQKIKNVRISNDNQIKKYFRETKV